MLCWDSTGRSRWNPENPGSFLFCRSCLPRVWLRWHHVYTRKGFQHWQQEDDNKCPFCGADDGFEHRLWECPNFDLQRNKIPVHTRTLIDALPPCSRCHGWPVRIPSQVLLLQALDAVEDVSSASYHLEHCLGPVVDLFTDGSCLLPQNHVLRLAAWAICIAKPWVSEWEHDIIASGWVAGVQQTAFRAELLAMVHAARIALMTDFQFRVWTDCLTLVTSVRRIQVADFDCGPNMAHGDLWFELRTMVHDLGGRFQVYHVFSHIPPSLGRSSVEQWIFWHNGLADKAAERANHTRGRNFWLLWSQCAWEQLQFRQCFDAIADLIVLTGRLAEQQTKSPDMPAQPPKKVPEAHLPFEGHSCSVPEKVVQKYGFPAVQWLHQWWMATGDICLQKCSHLKWVSFLQLYVDYALTTDQMGPLLWQGRWFFGTQQFPGPHLPCFAQQCRWFQMMVKSYWDHNSLPIRVKAVRPHSTSVICWLNCALLPWDDGRLAYVDEVVRHLNGGSIVKKCTAIQSFARVPMHAPWAVSPPTVGYRGWSCHSNNARRPVAGGVHPSKSDKEWFQIFFMFIPIWGRFPVWLIFFRWVETTNQISNQEMWFLCEMMKWLQKLFFTKHVHVFFWFRATLSGLFHPSPLALVHCRGRQKHPNNAVVVSRGWDFLGSFFFRYMTWRDRDIKLQKNCSRIRFQKVSSKKQKSQVGLFIWAVLSDEQMSKGWPFSLLNDEQMSNWLGVEHQPVCCVLCMDFCFLMANFPSDVTSDGLTWKKLPSVATLEFYYGFCGGPCVPWSFKLQKKSSERLSKSIESRILIDPHRIIKLRSVFSHCIYWGVIY